MFSDAIAISNEEKIKGNLIKFRDFETNIELEIDKEFNDELLNLCKSENISAAGIDSNLLRRFNKDYELDHGTMVPMYFINKYYTDYKLVHITYSILNDIELYKFGMAIQKTAKNLNKNTVIIASGDLSHRLTEDGPYEYSPQGAKFDKELIENLENGNVVNIFNMDKCMIEEAGECGIRSLYILLGDMEGNSIQGELLSYEGPFGVGYGVMKFNMACIRLFEGIKYVLPILHPNKKRLALIMCPEEDSASVEWARQKGENWVNKDITSLEFVENIFRLMNWNRECRYKVLGRVANSDQGLCMLFDLEEAIMFTPKPQEYADPLTGEMKKKQMKFFPDTYRNRIGKSYNDYIADHQMNMFEDFIGYQGSAVLDEPVREEDSFSKESMSQESEISENILLPDLAKQSESIEQQSGEIAERGMQT